MTRPGSKTRLSVEVVEPGGRRRRNDALATEEPLEIRLLAGGVRRTVAVTMRTPGADFELAAGFLYGEGVVTTRDEIETIRYCVDAELDAAQQYNIVNVALRRETLPELGALDRHFYTSSACGVCGKASLEALRLRAFSEAAPGPQVPTDVLFGLPQTLRAGQGLFDATGGLHAAGLFDPAGRLLALREDVGRHNAVDKLIGWALLGGRIPLHDQILLVSGRASFEIVQKCLVAGVPILSAVSAPSNLAVDLARAFGLTLVGFLRGERCNIYAGGERIS